MSIIKLVSINQYILAVYYTSAECYKYSIIDDYGTVYEPDDIFYSWEAAIALGNPPFPKEMSKLSRAWEGREAINIVSN